MDKFSLLFLLSQVPQTAYCASRRDNILKPKSGLLGTGYLEPSVGGCLAYLVMSNPSESHGGYSAPAPESSLAVASLNLSDTAGASSLQTIPYFNRALLPKLII